MSSNRPKAEKFSAAEKTSARIFELSRYMHDGGGSSELIKVAKDALDEIDSVLHEMRSLSEHAAGDKMTPFERNLAQDTINEYIKEVDRIVEKAEAKALRLQNASHPDPRGPMH